MIQSISIIEIYHQSTDFILEELWIGRTTGAEIILLYYYHQIFSNYICYNIRIMRSKLNKMSKKNPVPPNPFDQLQRVNYSALSALESVLKDEASFSVYHNYIKNNPSLFHDKVVMHLASDCNCFYSIFAAQAGAKIVYCILNGHGSSQTKNAFMMEQILKQNGYEDRVKVKLWREFKIQGKVDVIIGEPMGCNLFYDGMIDRMIQARDMYLTEQNGYMIPDRLRYKCALIWDEYQKDDKIQYWDQVYGVNMKEMKQWVQQEPSIKIVDPTLVITDVSKLIQFSLYSVNYEQVDEIKKNVNLKPLGKQNLKSNGLVTWFEADFTCADGGIMTIDASPWSEETRWSHLTLYTKDEWILKEGQSIKIGFSAKKSHLNGNICVRVRIGEKQNIYTIW